MRINYGNGDRPGCWRLMCYVTLSRCTGSQKVNYHQRHEQGLPASIRLVEISQRTPQDPLPLYEVGIHPGASGRRRLPPTALHQTSGGSPYDFLRDHPTQASSSRSFRRQVQGAVRGVWAGAGEQRDAPVPTSQLPSSAPISVHLLRPARCNRLAPSCPKARADRSTRDAVRCVLAHP